MPPLLMTLVRRQAVRSAREIGHPRLLCGGVPLPAVRLLISGITRDNTGTVLASCSVALYLTATDQLLERVTSDANGAFTFSYVGLGQTYYIVAYKTGTPVRGTSDNTLVGTVNG